MKALPYVQLSYEEAISGKRELLSSQANILKILKIIQNYKLLRKRELIKKDRLRIELANLKKKIRTTLIELPEIEQENQEISSTTPTTIKELTKTKSIDAELVEIQEKLAKLGEQ